jgi:hypothetical protein
MSSSPPPVIGAMQAPAEGDEPKSGLHKVMLFGVLQLVGLALGWVGGLLFFLRAFSGFTTLTPGQTVTPSQASALLVPFFRDLSVLVFANAAIQVLGVIFLLLGLRELARLDSRFSAPYILTIVMLVGTLLVIVGAVPLFLDIPNLAAQLPSTTGVTPSPGFVSAIGLLIGYFALIAIGGIVTFIGFVGGQMLGLWRIGSKYNETLLKLGAIFWIIPFLDIVAPVLVIVGANQLANRLPTVS